MAEYKLVPRQDRDPNCYFNLVYNLKQRGRSIFTYVEEAKKLYKACPANLVSYKDSCDQRIDQSIPSWRQYKNGIIFTPALLLPLLPFLIALFFILASFCICSRFSHFLALYSLSTPVFYLGFSRSHFSLIIPLSLDPIYF